MRYISTPRKNRAQGLAAERHRRNLARAGRLYRNTRLLPVRPGRVHKEYLDLEVPDELCLDTKYSESMRFINLVRKEAQRSPIAVRLRFESCIKIRPSALLLLLAEVHRARLLRGASVLTGTYPKDEKLLRRMCDMGFFDVLDIRSPIRSKQTFPMELIKFRAGTKLKSASARELRTSLLGDKIAMKAMPRSKLQRGVVEAMLNALQHAYPDGDSSSIASGVKNRWWICGHYHRPTQNLSIMFCDLGVGIPRTLPRRYPMEHIRRFLALLPGIGPDDGAMIYAGMEIGRTQTHLTNRGKGLNDLRHFIDQAGGGSLTIHSRKGRYHYSGHGTDEHDTLDQAVGGTLIHWAVPIGLVTNWAGESDEGDADDQDRN